MDNGISLSELAKKLRVNKSKLSYYVSKGVLKPEASIGGMYIFNEKETRKTLKEVKKLQRKKHSLNEIKTLLK